MSDWTSNDWAILLGACSAVVASCCAGARLSACVKISCCGENGWLYIERRLPTPRPAAPSVLSQGPGQIQRTVSSADLPDIESALVTV